MVISAYMGPGLRQHVGIHMQCVRPGGQESVGLGESANIVRDRPVRLLPLDSHRSHRNGERAEDARGACTKGRNVCNEIRLARILCTGDIVPPQDRKARAAQAAPRSPAVSTMQGDALAEATTGDQSRGRLYKTV